MRDLLTFPIAAVNFCLSMHFHDWLSVWSEQLQAKCVCQLRQSPLAFCCPKKDQKKRRPPFHSPCDTPPKPPNIPLLPISLLPTSSFPFSHDSSAGKPTINDFSRRPSVWGMALQRAQLSTRKKNDLHILIMCRCAQLIKELQGCHSQLKLQDPHDVNEYKLMLLMLNGQALYKML